MLSAKDARSTINLQLDARLRRDLLTVESQIESAISAGNAYIHVAKGGFQDLARVKSKLTDAGYSTSEDGAWLKVSW